MNKTAKLKPQRREEEEKNEAHTSKQSARTNGLRRYVTKYEIQKKTKRLRRQQKRKRTKEILKKRRKNYPNGICKRDL